MVANKQHAHELIEQLHPTQVPVAIGMLERLLDPVAAAVANAPVDDEQLSADDKKALDEAREASKSRRWVPHDEVLAEFGLTPEDIDKFQERK
jgi:hypothetical protein